MISLSSISLISPSLSGHGVKVQEIVFADGIKFSFCYPLRRHDSTVMDASDILLQLDLLFIPDAQHPNGNPNVPACCVTDQAYVATDHLIPKTRTQTLAALPPAQRAVIAAEDAANMRPRENIEDVFAKHVALFPAANKAARQRLFRAGRNHWNDICDTVSAAAFLSL